MQPYTWSPSRCRIPFRKPLLYKSSFGLLGTSSSCLLKPRALDPWKVLEVDPSATESDIKRAHRRLVKESHPDLAKGDATAHARFITIQEAYEILIGRRRGKEEDTRNSGWNFHDWYWTFTMKRRKNGCSPTPDRPSSEESRRRWQQQVQGLKARAATRTKKGRRPFVASSSSENSTVGHILSAHNMRTKSSNERFVNNDVKSQLAGLMRKAALKQSNE